MSRRLIVLVILTVSILTACGRADSSAPAGGYRIFLESGFSNGVETVKVVDPGTGTVERELPLGTPASDWSRYYTVTQLPGGAQLTALDPASGQTLAQVAVPAGYRLPNIAFQGPTAGISPNGQWLALTQNSPSPSGGGQGGGTSVTTNFLVGSSSLTDSFKTIHVNGDFVFDALSNDGKSLYLIQKMTDANHYRVRLYDVGAGSLTPQVVADKRESNEPMNGIRGDSVADPTGNYVYTVYIRQAGPFIHALPLDQQFAWCIDLPSRAPNDMEKQFHWALAVSRDGGSVYAANASLATVAVMTTGQPPKIVRTAFVAYNSPPPQGVRRGGGVISADAKGPRIGGTALSADGRTLYTFADHGLVAIDTTTLKVRAHYLESYQPETMRLSSDGKRLYVAESGNSMLWQIDPSTGAVAEVKGVTNPWALLWAQPK
jgi:DNA-binding beta-propeller fold protein YncE